jgi:pimeloyl-ACP methyl ester carboxylesterase
MQPTLVLIHGIGQDKNAWQFLQRDRLGDLGVQTFEISGHGETPREPGMTWASLADRLVEQYSGPLDLVSVGAPGEIVLSALVRYPHRIRSAAIFAGGRLGSVGISDAVRAERNRRADDALANGMASFVDEVISRWFGSSSGAPDTPAMAYARATLLHMDPKAWADAQYADLLAEPTTPDQLSRITQPVSVIGIRLEQPVRAINGDNASFSQHSVECATRLHSIIKSSRLIEGTGGAMIHLTNPDKCHQAIKEHLDWVKRG